jgi:hypothetical protein
VAVFLCGGQSADKTKTKKAVTTHILRLLLLFFCTPVENKKAQYRAIRCNEDIDKTLVARCLLIAMCCKIFMSGGQMADTE